MFLFTKLDHIQLLHKLHLLHTLRPLLHEQNFLLAVKFKKSKSTNYRRLGGKYTHAHEIPQCLHKLHPLIHGNNVSISIAVKKMNQILTDACAEIKASEMLVAPRILECFGLL